jgi:hypothetical protein
MTRQRVHRNAGRHDPACLRSDGSAQIVRAGPVTDEVTVLRVLMKKQKQSSRSIILHKPKLTIVL